MRLFAIMGLFASLFGGGCGQPEQPASSQQNAPQQPQMSQRLASIAFLALDHGIESIKDGADPLIPFVISEQPDGKRKLDRYFADTLEESVARARAAVSALPSSTTAYALAHDGFITIKGTKYDAILVEASERGQGRAVQLAQRYVPKKPQQNFERIGNAAYAGECESRLR
jgi:hypothetical protein